MVHDLIGSEKIFSEMFPGPVDFRTIHMTYRWKGDPPLMQKRSFMVTSAAGMTLAASALAFSQAGHAPVNGLNLYYEIHGMAEPLILLHGSLGAGEMFREILPLLADSRRVITVDLRAHGRTADIDRPLAFESMADDIAALASVLGIENAEVMDYSPGAGVAVRTTVPHRRSSLDFPMRPKATAALGELGIPRFPCEVSAYAHGVPDRAGLWHTSRYRRSRWVLPLLLTASASRRDLLTRLNARPARSPANASTLPLCAAPHDSGPMRVASSHSYDFCIHYTSPV